MMCDSVCLPFNPLRVRYLYIFFAIAAWVLQEYIPLLNKNDFQTPAATEFRTHYVLWT